MSIYYIKEDIYVKKIKVKNAFSVFSALSHVYPFIYFYNTYINKYGYQLSILIDIMHVDTTNIKIVITPQREHCKSAPHDCCLSINPPVINPFY